MKDYFKKLKDYFISILKIDDIKILVGSRFGCVEINEDTPRYDVIDYFKTKKLYFDSNTNTLMTFCPYNGSQLKNHPEISTLQCDDYFKWIILFKVFNENYLKRTVATPIRRICGNECIIIDIPNQKIVLETIDKIYKEAILMSEMSKS